MSGASGCSHGPACQAEAIQRRMVGRSLVRPFKGRPPRLAQVYSSNGNPIYFVTFNTFKREQILANPDVHDAFLAFARRGIVRGAVIGGYVIMPDHVHVFVRLEPSVRLGGYFGSMKLMLSKRLKSIGDLGPHWQEGFFDHVMRNGESCSEKWNYVRMNPVRAGLVSDWQEWPYRGELEHVEW